MFFLLFAAHWLVLRSTQPRNVLLLLKDAIACLAPRLTAYCLCSNPHSSAHERDAWVLAQHVAPSIVCIFANDQPALACQGDQGPALWESLPLFFRVHRLLLQVSESVDEQERERMSVSQIKGDTGCSVHITFCENRSLIATIISVTQKHQVTCDICVAGANLTGSISKNLV